MRYTIPGWDAAHYRRVKSGDTMTRAERWRITLMGDRLRGIRNGADRPVSVHRERVRFGAWEERPTSVAWKSLDLTPYLEEFNAAVKAITDAYLQNPAAVAAVERSLAQTGTGEGLAVSGPENVECGCGSCDQAAREALIAAGDWTRAICRPFIVCPLCGNKRCPRATHHDNDCTGSNEPGQEGSAY